MTFFLSSFLPSFFCIVCALERWWSSSTEVFTVLNLLSSWPLICLRVWCFYSVVHVVSRLAPRSALSRPRAPARLSRRRRRRPWFSLVRSLSLSLMCVYLAEKWSSEGNSNSVAFIVLCCPLPISFRPFWAVGERFAGKLDV